MPLSIPYRPGLRLLSSSLSRSAVLNKSASWKSVMLGGLRERQGCLSRKPLRMTEDLFSFDCSQERLHCLQAQQKISLKSKLSINVSLSLQCRAAVLPQLVAQIQVAPTGVTVPATLPSSACFSSLPLFCSLASSYGLLAFNDACSTLEPVHPALRAVWV